MINVSRASLLAMEIGVALLVLTVLISSYYPGVDSIYSSLLLQ